MKMCHLGWGRQTHAALQRIPFSNSLTDAGGSRTHVPPPHIHQLLQWANERLCPIRAAIGGTAREGNVAREGGVIHNCPPLRTSTRAHTHTLQKTIICCPIVDNRRVVCTALQQIDSPRSYSLFYSFICMYLFIYSSVSPSNFLSPFLHHAILRSAQTFPLTPPHQPSPCSVTFSLSWALTAAVKIRARLVSQGSLHLHNIQRKHKKQRVP